MVRRELKNRRGGLMGIVWKTYSNFSKVSIFRTSSLPNHEIFIFWLLGTESELFDMDTSKVSNLPSSVKLPTCTATLSGFHTAKASTVTDRTSAQAVLIKGVGVPLYQITQQEGHNLPFQLTSTGTSFAIDNAHVSVVLAPQPQTVLQKSPAQTLTLNIVNHLTLMSQNCSSAILGTSPAKSKNIGKHICAHCGRDCLKPSVLEKHIRSHTGERPFPCTICGISFKTQSNLYKHRRTQTHVNNAKQSFDSDCAGCQEDQNTGLAGERHCLDISKAVNDICISKDQCNDIISVDSRTLFYENNGLPCLVNKDILSSVRNYDQVVGEPDCASPSKDSMSILSQKRSLKDQITTMTNRHAQLQRQSGTCADKPLDCSSSQRKLKKCESTDSGYLSHSDSADLQMFSSSPLHSLSECSFESEPLLNTTRDCEDKTTSSKKNLEDHISMLISQNKAVVDNTHLDNVRPRKTTLSKQGSIDLPMPYTFKDSFHFDIKSLDVNRKKISLCSVNATITPQEKNKAMFFHSVPTQISSSIDNVILARSNSLPFVENGRVQDSFSVRSTKAHLQGKQPVNVTFANLLLSNTATACTVDFSSSHPRGLVRQAAVDEVQTNNVSESHISEESKEVKRLEGEQITPKFKAANRKAGHKKVNMFSHEKWQMYGDETFKKFYQKTNKSEHPKKTKPEVQDSNCEVRSKTILQTTMAKPLESLSSPPQVVPPISDSKFTSTSSKKCLFKTISVISKATEATLPLRNIQKDLDVDRKNKTILRSGSGNEVPIDGKGCKLKSHNPDCASNAQTDCPQCHLQGQTSQSVDDSDNIGNMVTEKLSIASNIEENMPANFIGSSQNHEQSPSERKKLKVAKKKGDSLQDTKEHSISNETAQVKCFPERKAFKELPVSKDYQQNMTMNFRRDPDILATESLDRVSRDNSMQKKTESNAIIYSCTSPGTTSQGPSEYKMASTIAKSSQATELETTNGFQAELFNSTPVKSILPQEQGSSPYNTAHLCWHSGICNMRVTKVTFSTLNTEPKSTWCWLDKCLPLPIEQKEKSFSVYASLNCNSIKDKRPVQAPLSHSRSVDKYQATSAGQLMASSIVWKSSKQKDCSEGIKQSNENNQQSAKRSSRMGARTKSRHMKGNKDSCREHRHSKVVHRKTHKGLCQNQRQKKTCSASSIKSGDILQRTTISGSRDHADTILTLHPPALHSVDKKEEGECAYGMDSHIDEGTSTKIAPVPLLAPNHQLTAGEKNKSQLSEEFASLKSPHTTSLSWQKSCNLPTGKDETASDQLTSEIKRVHLQQDLVDGPPQKHGRRILHRSKTIGHSMGEETTAPNHNLKLHNSSLPLLANVGLQARVPTDSKKVVCSPSRQNSRKSVIGACEPSKHNSDVNASGKAVVSGELPMGENMPSQNHCRTSDLEQRSLKFQNKVNLEVMRKQTYVEYSDTSSDDEDRLYIEIERD
ncbi:PREDICTED: zinc finger protein 831 [Nanorana parkeri]|uniref:zinc finger protein 831 n=1 Tax=Nanorana parkeri TaxID=125878 RepID=UPI0008544FD9|nr:PREDICTED: zinc finger protein 831 [Nanorana parkeri]